MWWLNMEIPYLSRLMIESEDQLIEYFPYHFFQEPTRSIARKNGWKWTLPYLMTSLRFLNCIWREWRDIQMFDVILRSSMDWPSLSSPSRTFTIAALLEWWTKSRASECFTTKSSWRAIRATEKKSSASSALSQAQHITPHSPRDIAVMYCRQVSKNQSKLFRRYINSSSEWKPSLALAEI